MHSLHIPAYDVKVLLFHEQQLLTDSFLKYLITDTNKYTFILSMY